MTIGPALRPHVRRVNRREQIRMFHEGSPVMGDGFAAVTAAAIGVILIFAMGCDIGAGISR